MNAAELQAENERLKATIAEAMNLINTWEHQGVLRGVDAVRLGHILGHVTRDELDAAVILANEEPS